MIGSVDSSYVTGVSIHESYNRAFAIHGTHNLRLHDNVVYNAMGHNFFLEDAVETRNVITQNLVIKTTRSWSLLNTDQTPAAFYITHPDNDLSGNHAAGSDMYSFWYDLQVNSMGASADSNICPEYDQVGLFTNNTGHSNIRYGLRIFHRMVPRQFPCKPISYDPLNLADPFHSNRLQKVEFRELTAWKNGRNGAIAGEVGDVRFVDFKVADNYWAGIEFENTKHVPGTHKAGVYNAMVIARS